MVHLRNLWMILKEFNNLLCVFSVAFKAKRQSFCSLQKKEGIERRNCRTLVAKKNCADVGYKSSRSYCICKRNAVVAWIWFSNRCILAGFLPVKLAGVNNYTAKSRSVAANKFCSRMNNNVCSVFNRTDKEWSSKSVVYNNRKTMLVCKSCNGINVRNVGIGIAKCFKINSLCVGLDCSLYFRKIVGIYKSGLHTVKRQSVSKKIVASAVNCLLCNNVLSLLSKSLNRIGNCRRTACNRKSRNAALKSRNALFKNILCGICKTAVNVTRISQTKTVCRML